VIANTADSRGGSRSRVNHSIPPQDNLTGLSKRSTSANNRRSPGSRTRARPPTR
jgi:hypothetical protein